MVLRSNFCWYYELFSLYCEEFVGSLPTILINNFFERGCWWATNKKFVLATKLLPFSLQATNTCFVRFQLCGPRASTCDSQLSLTVNFSCFSHSICTLEEVYALIRKLRAATRPRQATRTRVPLAAKETNAHKSPHLGSRPFVQNVVALSGRV